MKKSVTLATIKKLATISSKIDDKYKGVATAIDSAIKIIIKAIGKDVAAFFVDTYWEDYKRRHGITESVLTPEYKEALKQCLAKFVAEKRFNEDEIAELMYDLDYSEGFLSMADKSFWPRSIVTPIVTQPGEAADQPNLDKGIVNINYTNHKGADQVFPAFVDTIERKTDKRSGQPKAHISVELHPTRRRVSLAVYRINNWAQIQPYI